MRTPIIFFGDVNAGLVGYYHARLKGADAIARIVHVESEMMSHAVEKYRPSVLPCRSWPCVLM